MVSQEIFSTVRWGANVQPDILTPYVSTWTTLVAFFRGSTWACALTGLLSRRHSRGKTRVKSTSQSALFKKICYTNTTRVNSGFRHVCLIKSEVHDDGTDVLYL